MASITSEPAAREGGIGAFAGGMGIGTLGGLIGLGGAEFRLPLLIGMFRFGPLEAVIVNKAMSLIVVATALPLRTGTVSFGAIADQWTIIANLLAGSLVGAWVGASSATRLRSEALYRVIAVLLVAIAGILVCRLDCRQLHRREASGHRARRSAAPGAGGDPVDFRREGLAAQIIALHRSSTVRSLYQCVVRRVDGLVLRLVHLIPEFADSLHQRAERFESRIPDALLSDLHGVAVDRVVGPFEPSQARRRNLRDRLLGFGLHWRTRT